MGEKKWHLLITNEVITIMISRYNLASYLPGGHLNETAPVLKTLKHLRKNPRSRQFFNQAGNIILLVSSLCGRSPGGVTSKPKILKGI